MAKKYRVGLVQTVTEGATLYIEADSFDEAERLAFEQANAGTVEWQFLDTFEPVEIVTLDEVAEPTDTNSRAVAESESESVSARLRQALANLGFQEISDKDVALALADAGFALVDVKQFSPDA